MLDPKKIREDPDAVRRGAQKKRIQVDGVLSRVLELDQKRRKLQHEKDHLSLGEHLDLIDIPRATKLAGSRTYILKNEGALLELAVLQYTLEYLRKQGFGPMIVPTLVRREAMVGTAYFPGGEEQAYTCEKDDLYLIGTSEG